MAAGVATIKLGVIESSPSTSQSSPSSSEVTGSTLAEGLGAVIEVGVGVIEIGFSIRTGAIAVGSEFGVGDKTGLVATTTGTELDSTCESVEG